MRPCAPRSLREWRMSSVSLVAARSRDKREEAARVEEGGSRLSLPRCTLRSSKRWSEARGTPDPPAPFLFFVCLAACDGDVVPSTSILPTLALLPKRTPRLRCCRLPPSPSPSPVSIGRCRFGRAWTGDPCVSSSASARFPAVPTDTERREASTPPGSTAFTVPPPPAAGLPSSTRELPAPIARFRVEPTKCSRGSAP